MRSKAGRMAVCLAAAAAITWSLSGCGQRPEPQSETSAQTEKHTEAAKEPVTEKVLETEAETQKLITSVDYTSKDGSVKITLPDNTWKVTQDADEMRVFQSGNAAIINIVHAATESAMKNLSVMTSQEELEEGLTKQYPNKDDYEVEDFTTATVGDINIYRYVVKYNASARMWAYSVTNAIVAADEAYVVTGTVTDDNAPLLASVRKAVESFQVPGDEDFKAATGEVISGTTQKTTEKQPETTASDAELSSLQDYGTTAALVTNDVVNVRMQPGTDAGILVTLNGDTQVNVVGETSGWFKVNISGNIGYIRKDFLVYGTSANKADTTQSETSAQTTDTGSGNASSAEISTATQYGSATTLYASDVANVRSAPGTDSSVIDALGAGGSVTVTGETDNWFIVNVGGVTGYVSKSLLTSDSSVAANTGSSTGSGGSYSGDSGSASSGSGSSSDGATSISGQVTSAGVDTLTVTGSDGKNYTVYYGDANVTSSDGLYNGVYVNISLDPSQAPGDGTLYATNVSGS